MTEAAPPREKRSALSLVVQGTVALAGSIATLWWALHDVNLTKVAHELAESDFAVIGLFLLGHIVLHALRIARWGILVKPLGNVTNGAVAAAGALGFPATFFLPLRLGEFVRPVLISRAGAPFAGAMASVVVERIADGIANLAFFFVALSLIPPGPLLSKLDTVMWLAPTVFGGAFVFLIVACVARRPAIALVRKIGTPISAKITEAVVGLLDTFIDGAMVLKSPARLLPFLGLTLVYWVSAGLLAWFLFTSYLPELPIVSGYFTTGVGAFMIMIPAGPAFAGTLEAGFKLGLEPFGVTPDGAAVMALAFHAVQLILMALSGAAGFLLVGGLKRGPVAPKETDA
ncbi:MAG: lysylphosphatidylglycerol synthase transmembrane domain-containing protein [Deltaproteobacteria bacterium]|jgi:uncharacterized protein (TIRG00374 family)